MKGIGIMGKKSNMEKIQEESWFQLMKLALPERAHLRLEPTKNNQEKNVRWAKDYEL